MQLAAYIHREKLNQAEFAARLVRADGTVVSQAAVSRYAAGQQIPDREIMPLIVAATNGEVTPNDFFAISASRADGAAPDTAEAAAS